jgi:hypothetical protein
MGVKMNELMQRVTMLEGLLTLMISASMSRGEPIPDLCVEFIATTGDAALISRAVEQPWSAGRNSRGYSSRNPNEFFIT